MANTEEVVDMPNKVRPYLKPLDQSEPGLTIKATETKKTQPSKSLKDFGDTVKKMTKD